MSTTRADSGFSPPISRQRCCEGGQTRARTTWRRRALAVTGMLLATTLLAACGGGGGGGAKSTSSAPQKTYTIGFSFGQENTETYSYLIKGFRESGKKLGLKIVEGAANGDCVKQVQDIQGFVARKVDAILFWPSCGVKPYAGVVKQAQAAGIKLASYGQPYPGIKAALLADQSYAGNLMASYMVNWYRNTFTGDKHDFSWGVFTFNQCGECKKRTDPIIAAGTKAFGVKPLQAEAIDKENGLKVTQTWLQKEPGLDLVVGVNDAGALGAYQALLNAHKNGKQVFVGGIDGETEALQLVAQGGGPTGLYRASVGTPPDAPGRSAAALMAAVVRGQTSSAESDRLNRYRLFSADKPQDAIAALQGAGIKVSGQ